MRLIGGFLHFGERPAERRRIEAMATAMTAPGLNPRASLHVDGPLALAVLDFAPAPQKYGITGLPCGPGGTILAADIRLDEPVGTSDNQQVIALLEKEGLDGLARLAGDFAFAAWNPRTRTLSCVRDGFGVRPLFFAHRPKEVFVFASLPRGLFASGLTARKVNDDFVINEFMSQHGGPENSLFIGVERLAPGGWLRIGEDGRSTRGHHWRPDRGDTGTARITPEAAAEELSRRIVRAVRRRLPTTGPVATHLSGGVDSSALTVLAARDLRPTGRTVLAYSLTPAPFRAYTFGNEGPFIAPVLQQGPNIRWSPMQVEDQAAFVFPIMDEDHLFPADPRYPEVRIFADAAARGAKTLLSGWGGDEGCSYTGRGVLAEALLAGRWVYLAKELGALATAQKRSPLRVARNELSPYLLTGKVCDILRRWRGRGDEPALPRVMADLLLPDKITGRDMTFAPMPPDARRIRHDLRFLPPGPSRRAEQWALIAARYGMTAAFPLLDREVVAFALSLPSDLFLRGGWSRRVFRDAMAGVLPDELRWKRGKQDILTEGPLYSASQRSLIQKRLSEWRHHPRIAALFDFDAVAARLSALPPTDDLARIMDGAVFGDRSVGHALSLLRASRFMSYLEQWG